MLLAAIDTDALVKVVYASLIAGTVIVGTYVLALYGATRYVERRRARSGAAIVFAALGVLGLAGFLAAVVLGFVVMINK
jgi:hypothetical protein